MICCKLEINSFIVIVTSLDNVTEQKHLFVSGKWMEVHTSMWTIQRFSC